MDIQLTATEIQNISQLLQDYAPAQKTLALLNETNGDLEKSFAALWTELHGRQVFSQTKL